MSNRLTIDVEGVERELVPEIEETIRESFEAISFPGSWRVVVRPSPVSGRWDLRVYGLNVRHTLSIAVPANLLSSLIPSRLRESLEQQGPRQLETVAAYARTDDSTPASRSAGPQAGTSARTT